MAYDEAKDVCLWETRPENDGPGLCFGVYQYDGGEKKLQIGPRLVAKGDGTVAFTKAGRLTLAEANILSLALPDILKELGG